MSHLHLNLSCCVPQVSTLHRKSARLAFSSWRAVRLCLFYARFPNTIYNQVGASAAKWLGLWLLVLMFRGSIPRSPSTFRDLFLGPLHMTQLVHLYRVCLVPINVGSFPARTFGFNCVITSGNSYVCTSCPSLPRYSSLRYWYRRSG